MKIAIKLFYVFLLVAFSSCEEDSRPAKQETRDQKAVGRPPYLSCPRGLVFRCGNDCDNLCDNLATITCHTCKLGCFCPRGMINVGGFCVAKAKYCAEVRCPLGQEYDNCGNACFDQCDEEALCSMECQKGCYCPPGYVKSKDNSALCVSKEDVCEKKEDIGKVQSTEADQ